MAKLDDRPKTWLKPHRKRHGFVYVYRATGPFKMRVPLQQLLRLVVERIAVDTEKVTAETVIPTGQNHGKLRNVRGEPVEP